MEWPAISVTVPRIPKGQQAPVVILVDVDFPDWNDERAQRLLYTGMTRARQHLELVVHEPSRSCE